MMNNEIRIYITQLIFLYEGKEEVLEEFEAFALPLMRKYDGKLLHRIRPEASAFIAGEPEKPYEIHIITFPSEEKLAQFLKDESRVQFLHLKEEAVKSTLLVKGVAM